MSVELLSALIAVISLLGVIASNYYTYKARMEELKSQRRHENQNDRITYLRNILTDLADAWKEAMSDIKTSINPTGAGPNKAGSQSQILALIASIDDLEIQGYFQDYIESKSNIKNLLYAVMKRLGQMINEELQYSPQDKKSRWQFRK